MLLAAAEAAAAAGAGPVWIEADLDTRTARWEEPLALDRGWPQLLTLPAPVQGSALLIAQALLDAGHPAGSALDDVHRQVEAMRVSFEHVDALLGDSDHVAVEDTVWTSESALEDLRGQMDLRHRPRRPPWSADAGGAVLIVTADEDGQVVVLLQSNDRGFGSEPVFALVDLDAYRARMAANIERIGPLSNDPGPLIAANLGR